MLHQGSEEARYEDPFTPAEFDSLAKIGDRMEELWPQVREDWEFMNPRVLEAKRSGTPLDGDLAEVIARERLGCLGEQPPEARETDATFEALRANAQAIVDFQLFVYETVAQESTSGV